jgi:hypothetical protein
MLRLILKQTLIKPSPAKGKQNNLEFTEKKLQYPRPRPRKTRGEKQPVELFLGKAGDLLMA